MMLRRAVLSGLVLLAGCEVGPDYRKPPAPMALQFKELAGWKPASPMDWIDRGAWWSVYKDPLLDKLEHSVVINNQNVRAQLAAYQEAQALVDEARAGLFPVLGLTAGVTRSGAGGGIGNFVNGQTGTTTTGSTSRRSSGTNTTTFTAQGNASWDLDVWGKVRRQIESNVAGAQVSAADLANAALSAQGALATDYFEMRTSDALQDLLDRTVAAYRKTVEITQNQYDVGVAARSDLITAQVQLQSTVSQAIAVKIARQQYEHAIAVLSGVPPSDLTIAHGQLAAEVPVPPVSIPSVLLERRPDVAAAERTMQEENALIGVAVAGYYPTITLSGVFGFSGNTLGQLFNVANRVWSVGANAAETLFNAGLTGSQVRAAKAVYDESVANYRQTVLTAFQQVEDELVALHVLQDQSQAQLEATQLARRAVEITLNEYRAGTVAFTAVVTAQATDLADEETLLGIQQSRLVASVGLIEALGGGWTSSDLPTSDQLQTRNLLNPRNF
ncbi:MAG TPA: efflux transporter outer membrane subunit [Acidisphaera sp.]|nr:efflux transporter outer membrane subunit [Acidisphaera sp.]